MSGPRRVAVIGSGVAGLTAAYFASRTASVTLYEADDRLGGHADTHQVGELAIDTGFIVHNERTYPVLLQMFRELGVATQPSEMSLSVRDDATGLEWAGALGRRGNESGPAGVSPAHATPGGGCRSRRARWRCRGRVAAALAGRHQRGPVGHR